MTVLGEVTTIVNSAARTIYKLSYQISPIILTNGIAANAPGGMIPIVSLTESINFVAGLLSGGSDLSLDSFFAHYSPLPGSSLIKNEIGDYPFANQAVAANAVITLPTTISLHMLCPSQKPGSMISRLAIMTALQKALAQHTALGGTFIVATPSYIWKNLILLDLTDVTGGKDKQPQTEWQWNFIQPLITLAQAQQAQNSQYSKMTNGTPTDGSSSGGSIATGNEQSGATASDVPSGNNLQGTANTSDVSASGSQVTQAGSTAPTATVSETNLPNNQLGTLPNGEPNTSASTIYQGNVSDSNYDVDAANPRPGEPGYREALAKAKG